MIQYEMYFTNEYVDEILSDLVNVMGLYYENEEIKKAIGERDKQSKNNILLIKKENRFICIDCNDKDWIFPLIVRCNEKESEIVRTIMMKWDKTIREEYDQELENNITNNYGKEDTLLRRIEKHYNVLL